MPQYVILTHDYPEWHWDFMLEGVEGLQTWRLEFDPVVAEAAQAALALPLHRIEYLDYEGPVSRNRGTVARFDRGVYTLLAESEQMLRLELSGQRLRGIVELTLIHDHAEHPLMWRYLFQPAEGGEKI